MQAVKENQNDDPSDVAFLITRRELADDTSLLSVEGDLDLASAPSLKWALADLQRPAAGTSSSTSQRSASSTRPRSACSSARSATLDPGVKLAIACAEENVLRIFELTGLDGMFEIVPTLQDALGYVQGSTTAAG